MRQKARRINRPPGDCRFSARFRARRPFGLQSCAWTIHIAFSRQRQHGASGILNRGFAVMALAMLCRAGAWWALMRSAAYAAGVGCASMGCPAAKAAETELHVVAAKPACLNAAETRETVKSRHLLEPFAAIKFAGAQRKAEALSAKLCRSGDDFVYEITLLLRDGRLVHVDMEAGTGKIASRPPREPHEAHEPHDAHEPHESHEAHEPPVKN
jgi:hypothetical protein